MVGIADVHHQAAVGSNLHLGGHLEANQAIFAVTTELSKSAVKPLQALQTLQMRLEGAFPRFVSTCAVRIQDQHLILALGVGCVADEIDSRHMAAPGAWIS